MADLTRKKTRTGHGANQTIDTYHGQTTHTVEKGASSASTVRTSTAGARIDSSAQTRQVGERIDQAAIHAGAEIAYKIAVPPWLGGGAI